MKRFAIAAVLALGFLACGQEKASASGFGLGNFGFDLSAGLSFRWYGNQGCYAPACQYAPPMVYGAPLPPPAPAAYAGHGYPAPYGGAPDYGYSNGYAGYGWGWGH